jgi:hypothetical protein
MNDQELQEKIREHNEKVDFNKSAISWIIDIIACLIFFPMIILIVYRRGKYNKHKKNFD